jgi:YD repeat-containing protein
MGIGNKRKVTVAIPATSTTPASTVTPYDLSGIVRDDAGRITEQVETIGGTATTYDYTYDVDGNLAQVDATPAGGTKTTIEKYTYDADGNRTSAQSQPTTAAPP